MNHPSHRAHRAPSDGELHDAVPVSLHGLTSGQAAERLRQDGPNLLPQAERRRRWGIVLNVVREPMLALLLAATTIYLMLGDPGDAALLGFSVLLVIALTVYQEQKSEHALQALRELSSPRARVMRNRQVVVLAASELVVGDLVLLAEGDRIPADARLIEATDLHVDESLLTGESVPVRRAPDMHPDESLLRASTLVVRGHGRAVVVATGARTAVGLIGVSLRAIRIEPTPLQREMRRVVALFAVLGIASCVLMTGLYVVLRGGWLEALLAGITLAIANIPEEFPVVLTVFLALGAWRMARHRALVRRIPAIETLGATGVLCTDKTGTLTRNHMAVAAVMAGDERAHPCELSSDALRAVLSTARLASRATSYDPMEVALHEAAGLAGLPGTEPDARQVREFPLTPRCPAIVHVWSQPGDPSWRVACKGAPETVADLCRLSNGQRVAALAGVTAMARHGLRVLGVAVAAWPADAELPASVDDFPFTWLGLVGFADPLRPGVSLAVAEARAAGVDVIMLTGDHVETARAIAAEAGIDPGAEVMLGSDIDALAEPELTQRLQHTRVFARVRPEHKLRLVDAIKRSGRVVAMTGDGVNDAPALMAAHVGIAMGGRGTDVAREASSIVLLDDDFVTVVRAIRLGRTIYDNIRRAVRYILAVHVPITGLALMPLVVGSPLILLPLHLVFLQLIIDPVCSLVFEREPAAADIMQRPPRPLKEPMLGLDALLGSLVHGLVMFCAIVAIYFLGARKDLPAPQLGALAFTALVMGNLGLIVLYRTGATVWSKLRQRNPALIVVITAALAILFAVTRLAGPSSRFGFSAPPWDLWLAALGLPLAAAALLHQARHGTGVKTHDVRPQA